MENKYELHTGSEVITLRYVYILKIDNRGRKSRFHGMPEIFYSGSTNNLERRMKEHIQGINCNFLKSNFPDARRILVYVEYVWGNELDVLEKEYDIKKNYKSKKKKLQLINSEKNQLIKYIVKEDGQKCIVLKKFNFPDEQIVLKF